jgi:hypothetical protein
MVVVGKEDHRQSFQGWLRLVFFLDGLEPMKGDERLNLSRGSEDSVEAR